MEFLKAGAVEARLQRGFEELNDVVVVTPAQGLHGPPLLDQLWQVGAELLERHQPADRRQRDQHRGAAPADPISEPAAEPGDGRAESRARRPQQAPPGRAKAVLPDAGRELAPVIGLDHARGERRLRHPGRSRRHLEAPPVDPGEDGRPLGGEQQGGRQDGREVAIVVVLVDGVERIALVEDGEPLVLEAPGTTVMAVVHDRPGGVAHPIPGQPESPAEIDVLVEEKVVVVEPADLQVRIALDDHRPATGKQDVARRRVDAGGLAITELDPQSGQRGAAPDEVDRPPVPAEDAAAGAGDVGRLGNRADQLVEPPGIGSRVIVEEGQQVGVELARRQVVSRGEPQVDR